jgi:hypothetical protein
MIVLLSTLRASATYQIPWEHWEVLMPVGPGSLSLSAVRRLHEDPDPALAVACLPPPAVSWSGEGTADLGHLEEALWTRVVHQANRQYYRTTGSSGVVIGYYYLKRQELRHLLGLTQMLRYGKGAAEIVDYLGL